MQSLNSYILSRFQQAVQITGYQGCAMSQSELVEFLARIIPQIILDYISYEEPTITRPPLNLENEIVKNWISKQ